MPIVRLYVRSAAGHLEDLQHDIDLRECVGVCPGNGDQRDARPGKIELF
jgi:hypothetical protein